MKIVYGIAGEGFGHSSRAHLIGQKLINSGHEVIFIASEKSYTYLCQYFKEKVKKIIGMFLVYNNRYLSTFRTFIFNSGKFPGTALNNFRLFRECLAPFEPDLIITDFEPFTAFWASWNNIPLLSIDHQHLLTNCVLEDFESSRFAKFNSQLVIKCFRIKADAHIILNFFNAPVKNDSTILVPPVVRTIAEEFNSTSENHILCYSTDNTNLDKMLSIFRKFPEYKFIIYGFNQDTEYENCTLRKRSTRGFLKDLSSCKAVIATAGFSLISECLYFRKRMLILPILGHFEQLVNAHFIAKLNLGFSSHRFDDTVLKNFLASIEEPIKPRQQILWPDNNKFFEVFDSVLFRLNRFNKEELFTECKVC